jgi:hypothetical protein
MTMPRSTAVVVFAALLIAWTRAGEAETIRYLHRPLGDGRDFTFDHQEHTTQTPFVEEGGTITVPRSFGSSLFVYKHGLDVTPVTVAGAGGVAFREVRRVNGVQSNVFLPTAVPGVVARAGAIGYTVLPGRELRVGAQRTVELRYPLGDRNTFVLVVGCHRTGRETGARLVSGTVQDNTLRPGQETRLRLEADLPPACGGQALTVAAPECFELINPATAQPTTRLALTWRESEPAAQTFTLRAGATCRTANARGEVTASLSGGILPRRPIVTWVPDPVSPTDRLPKAPGLPRAVTPAPGR